MKYKMLLRNKSYIKVTLANAINRLGDSLDVLLFSWLIYDISKNAALSAFMIACNMIPTVILQPIAGVIVERKDKRSIMCLSDLCRGLIVFIIFFIYINNNLSPLIVLLATILISTIEAFRVPSGVAIVPSLLDSNSIDYGVSFAEGLSQCFELLGVAIAGIILSLLGIKYTILIDVCIFLLSAFLLFEIESFNTERKITKIDSKKFIIEFKEGFIFFHKNKILSYLCILGLLLNMVMIPINSLQTPFVVEILHNGPIVLSAIGIISAVSMIIGTFIYPFLSKSISAHLLIFIGGSLCCINYLLWWIASKCCLDVINIVIVFLGTIIGVIGLSIVSNSIRIILLKEIDVSFLARISGMYNSVVNLSSPLLATFIGILVTNINIITVLFWCFPIFFCFFLLMYLYASKNIDTV